MEIGLTLLLLLLSTVQSANSKDGIKDEKKEEKNLEGKYYELSVNFDARYGGLHTSISVGKTQKFARVMLSTVHSRTFMVHGGTDKSGGKKCGDSAEDEKFCEEHADKYDPDKSTTQGVRPVAMKGELKGKGDYVEERLAIEDATEWVCRSNSSNEYICEMTEEKSVKLLAKQQIGLMYSGVWQNPNFWGIERVRDGELVTEVSLAAGALSLWPGVPEDAENFGSRTPIQNLLDIFSEYQLREPFVGIMMNKKETIDGNSKGIVRLGLGADENECPEWRVFDEHTTPWHFSLSDVAVNGTSVSDQSQTAVIDTTSEHIIVPSLSWDNMASKIPTGECDVSKLPTLVFTVGNFTYTVRPEEYLQKKNDSCVHLLVQGKSETVEQKWRLGLPFLRTHCVGLDLENKRVWVSDAGFKRDPEPLIDGAVSTSVFTVWASLLATFASVIAFRWL